MNSNTKFNPHARSKARRLALQAIYQWQCAKQLPKEIYEQFILEQDIKNAELTYFKEVLEAVVADHQALDEQCTPFLDRAITTLDPVELCLLRMGMYELIHHPEIPYRVVINEAVELAKKFGATDGHKYINGVLDKAAQEIRKIEIKG